MIITEGKSNNTFYVIKSGEATVTKAGAVLTTLKSGGFFGERALTRTPYPQTPNPYPYPYPYPYP